MRSLFFCVVVAAIFALTGAWLSAQEMIATPDPIGGEAAEAAAPASPTTAADAWRFRWFNQRWWYWTQANRWMWYSDDGQWVAYDIQQGPSPMAQNQMPPLPHGGYAYPTPGYIYSPVPHDPMGYYYPGVVVGAAPYGRVGVGVGRRVGVDVWGPHGSVRVGRIHVGW